MAARKKKKTEFNGYDTSTDAGFIKFFNTRFSAMDSARKFFEGIRKDDDAQIEAKSVRRDGVYYINIPLEATLCECSEGREGGKQEYVIEPLDEPDMTEIFVANSALTYHLAVGEFPIENEMALAERRIYGTCCMFT
ncbi:MAG: hypothetical protein LBU27_09945 [Candidatus Peribacteria bacterium]|jgi:hypothetical protein|nr:hypothetical protein [Candidatus Peribacteria bacterium]